MRTWCHILRYLFLFVNIRHWTDFLEFSYLTEYVSLSISVLWGSDWENKVWTAKCSLKDRVIDLGAVKKTSVYHLYTGNSAPLIITFIREQKEKDIVYWLLMRRQTKWMNECLLLPVFHFEGLNHMFVWQCGLLSMGTIQSKKKLTSKKSSIKSLRISRLTKGDWVTRKGESFGTKKRTGTFYNLKIFWNRRF